MRWLRRLALGMVVVPGVALGTNAVASSVDLSTSRPLAAYSPSTTAPAAVPDRPVTPTPTTTSTTAAPTTTTTTVPPATTTTAVATPAPAPIAAPAAAPVPSTPEEKGARALTMIDYPWQRLGYDVTFTGPKTGLLGKANCDTHQITVFVRPSQSVRQVAFVTAFELGHALDCGTMNPQRRGEWAAIRGFPAGWTWFPSCMCTEDAFGSGDISMVFATWLVPDGGYGWRSKLAPPPGASISQLLPYLRPASVG